MMKWRRILGSFVILTLVMLALASGTIQAAPSVQGAEVVNIGVIGPVDGPTLRGVSLAVDKANAQALTLPSGAPFTIGVVAVDANADQMAAAIGQLRSRNVVALFGPDDNVTAARSLGALSTAGIPVFTAATSSEVRTGGFLFRTRASDATRMTALADVLINDVRATRFAVYQGNSDVASQAVGLVAALAIRGLTASSVLQDPARATSDAVPVLTQSNPEVIAAFGKPAQVAELVRILRDSGFVGRIATDVADDREFISALPVQYRNGLYGITGWSFNHQSATSREFLLDYVTNFGEVPSAQSAAAYDAVNLLVRAIRQAGPQPAALLAAILASPPSEAIQGTFSAGFGNGELTNNAMVTQANTTGINKLIARYEGATRLPLEAVAALPTPTPFLPPPPTLPPAPQPTATPQGVVATVLSETINVRYGPGLVYNPPIGRLMRDEQVQIIGVDPSRTWYAINFQGRQAWISGDPALVSVFGDIRTLPILVIPPTPTPIATPTPTAPQLPTIRLVSASLSQNPIKLGTPFTLTVTLINTGLSAAGPFAVAAAFDPGGVFGAAVINGLAPGQTTTFTISYPGITGNPGTYTVAIVIDLNNQVQQSPEGEANKKPTITYQAVP